MRIASEISSQISKELKRAHHKRALGVELPKTGWGGDITKYGDDIAERVVHRYLKKAVHTGMADSIVLVAEESGITEFSRGKFFGGSSNKSIFVILDPVDGSNNMRPWKTPKAFLATSLALGFTKNLSRQPLFSAIDVGWVTNLLYDINYFAIANGGAYFTSDEEQKPSPLRVSPVKDLSEAIIVLGLDKSGNRFDTIWKKATPILREKKCQRRLGSTVLDLCLVAGGECDAYVGLGGNTKIHDIAATQLIVREARGVLELKQVRGIGIQNPIREMVVGRSANLIKDVSFQVLAAGTKSLFFEIDNLLKKR